MTANRVPTPPSGSVSKGGIYRTRKPPPAGNIPPMPSLESTPGEIEKESTEKGAPLDGKESTPESEEIDSEPDDEDDPEPGMDDSTVTPGTSGMNPPI